MQRKTLTLAIGVLLSGSVMAAQGDLLVRGRLIQVAPDVSTTGALSTMSISVDKQVVPELDFTYMLTGNVGAELILGTARHEVKAGAASLGKVNHLPPTLTLQYHFAPEANVRPYAGVGVNYTRFYNISLPGLNIDKNSFGLSFQAGTDIAINKDWYVNLDVKKIYIKTDVSAGSANLGTLKINPLVWGVGFGTKF